MKSKKKVLLLIAAISAVSLVCAVAAGIGILRVWSSLPMLGDTANAMTGMMKLSKKINAQFPVSGSQVGVSNGRYLVVSVTNYRFVDGSPQEKADAARNIAVFVKANFEDISKMDEITVNLVKNYSLVIFNFNQTESYRFKLNDL